MVLATERSEFVDSRQRQTIERVIAARMIAVLLVLLCGLSILAPSKSTIYQLVVFAPAALWCMNAGAARLKPEVMTSPARPTHWLVLASYAFAALTTAILSFSTWHEASDRQFSGIERGGGSYTLLFALILAFVIAGLLWRQTKQPVDTALHVAAVVCGTVFIGAAFSGTYSRGLSNVRVAILSAGVLTLLVALTVLRRRSTDTLSRQGYAAALFASGGALMAASSFMSWGGGSFINYRPGTSLGGFDGRITLWAGVGITAAWITHFFGGRDDEHHWPNMVRLTAGLGFAGLAGVLAGASGASQPGRALAAAACLFVLVSTADVGRALRSERPRQVGQPTPHQNLLTRLHAGVLALISTLLIGTAAAYVSSMRISRLRSEIDYDDLVAALSFGALGFTLLRAAIGSTRGRELSAHVAAVVLGGLALVFLIPPDRISPRGLGIAAVFVAVAILGIVASRSAEAAEHDMHRRLRSALRQDWLSAAVAAAVGYVAMRWLLPALFSNPTLPENAVDPQFEAYRLAWAVTYALRVSLALAAVALLSARRRDFAPTALATAASTVLCFTAWTILANLDLDYSEHTSIALASVTAAIALGFCLGRDRFAIVAMAVVVGALNPWFLDLVMFSLVPSDWLQITIVTEAVRSVGQVVYYFGLAIVFLAYPVGQRRLATT